MTTRLSPAFLYRLRNHIPIAELIVRGLRLPCKRSEGFLRFLCPICQEFRTACNPQTNLARCFLCEKNFNPIDLVMLVRQCTFRQAIDYLTPIMEERPPVASHR